MDNNGEGAGALTGASPTPNDSSSPDAVGPQAPEKKLSTREKKRKARKALLMFLKNMRRSCSMYNTADAWYGDVKKLKVLLEEYTDVLPEGPLKRVNEAMGLKDLTGRGITATCKILKHDVKKLATKLPFMGGVSSFLVKGLITVAVMTGGAAIVWQANKVKVTIANDGCSNIPIAREAPQELMKLLKAFGMKLPLWVVTNGRETFSVPAATLAVHAQNGGFSIDFLGTSAALSLPDRVTSVMFDGRELLNTDTSINLRSQSEHIAVVTCKY